MMRDYGPTIDDLYEQELKEARGKLLLKLDGRLVQTFDDTPAGREHCDKAAFQIMNEGEVTVDRMGAGGLATSQDPRGGREAASTVPAPLRSTGCCIPAKYPGPSGWRRRHSLDCPVMPGEVYREPVLKPSNLVRIHAMETRRTGLDDALARHPAGGTLTPTTNTCPAHPGGGRWWDCPTCSDRRDQ